MNGNRPDWFPDWNGECVAIIASGPSVVQADVDMLKDRIHVVAVNTSYELCRWADVLYACDHTWWDVKRGAKDFPGLKISQDERAIANYPDIKKISLRKDRHNVSNEMWFERYGEVGGGGNSGFQVLNLVAQMGATGIALLGFDMKVINGKIHFYGRHPHNNPDEFAFVRWTKWMTLAAPKLSERGIEVINCSAQSSLQCFKRMTVLEMLGRFGL